MSGESKRYLGASKPDSNVIRMVSEKSGQIDRILKAREAKERKSKQKADSKEQKGDGLGDQEITLREHLMSIEEVEKLHDTDLKSGLTTQQVAAKQEEYGFNVLTPPPTKHWFLLFLSHMTGFFSLLLWGAGILCFIAYALDGDQIENLYLGAVLVIVVFLTGCFAYYQDSKSAAVMEGFKNYLPPATTVLRNGQRAPVESKELVPGDIVNLKNGDKVPADLRVIHASNFKVDNASLTGESLPQKRTHENKHENPLEATNMAFFGTLVVNGKCTGIIVQTGDNTVIGTIAKLASSTDNKKTPIAEEIERFIRIISAVAIFLGALFLIIGIVKGTGAVENVVFCIGIIVANVPEGLLATVTVSLTLTAQRMAEKKVLVKNLESVETLGSTSVIASDKTGTLTQNKMVVAHLWYDNQIKLAHGRGDQAFNPEDTSFQLLRLCITLCNNAVFVNKPDNMAKEIRERLTEGDASESSFIKFSESIDGTGILNIRDQHPKVGEVPFNSHNKYQISIHVHNNDYSMPRILMMKGAPERIWDRCDSVLIDNQKIVKEEVEEHYQNALFRLMNGGERVLGCCMAELDPDQFPQGFEYKTDEPYNFPVSGLTFLGLISMIDPPRQAVPGAVLNCQTAGVKVVMVTGDHPDTAEAIAKQVHIIRDKTRRDLMVERKLESLDDVKLDDPEIQAQVITGAMLLDMNKAELDNILDYDQIVFARTSPQQKLIIVEGLQRKEYQRRGPKGLLEKPLRIRHVVAVTGDGVNDSPALKAANIGVAMGIAGSEVAKDAADMILLNDNFASIVDGVEEGRLIFDNLKKSIAYTLSSNIPEISPFLINILIGIPLPLPVVLILCIDLGTDMIPAISLAYENKESDIMKRPPRDMLTDRLVTVKLISFSYLQIGIVQALAGFFTYFVVLHDFGFEPSSLPDKQDIFDDDNNDQVVFSPSNPHDSANPLNIFRTATFDGQTITMHPCNIERRGVCHVPDEALKYAQTAFFVSIVIVQWADILACKTRTLSLKHQGMRNRMLNFGLFFETALAAILCYVPGLDGLGTRPINFVHWLPALPFAMMILSYDECRKYFLRNWGKDNWMFRNTYY